MFPKADQFPVGGFAYTIPALDPLNCKLGVHVPLVNAGPVGIPVVVPVTFKLKTLIDVSPLLRKSFVAICLWENFFFGRVHKKNPLSNKEKNNGCSHSIAATS
jgi:hypothetical protein